MRDNIVTAVAGDKLYIKTDSVFQYDYGLILKLENVELPESYTVHFANTGNAAAKTVTGDASGVAIPDEYLRNGDDIHAYVYLKNDDEYGYTVYHIQIPVVDRMAIDTEDITPIDHTFIEDALKTVAEAVEKTEENVENYPYINDDKYWMVYDANRGEFVNTGVKAQADGQFDLTIGNVTTLPPGSDYTASVTWDGSTARLNLGIPAVDGSSITPIHEEQSNQQNVSFEYGANNIPLDDMRVAILPIQEGSGTPGPRNVRRISGVTGLSLMHETTAGSRTYSVSFADTAGTVYGGTYYPLTGDLLVDRVLMTKRCVDMNNLEIQPGWRDSGIREIIGEGIAREYTGQVLNVGTSYGVDTTGDNDLLYLSRDQYGMRQTDWKNTEITVQICVSLPEPVVYHLDPISLSTASGHNRFSVDTGKIAFIMYPCDTKKYIDYKIAETQALVLEN